MARSMVDVRAHTVASAHAVAPSATGFPPVFQPQARILILGSLPGQRSLDHQQYYAHPHNQFWPMMQALFGIPQTADYADRIEQLLAAGVALWDVCHSARRAGSLDSAIETDSVVANPVPSLIAQLPACRCIAFNGQAAAKLFHKHIALTTTLPFLTLPSTSPAHASLTFSQKLAVWQGVKTSLREPLSGS